MIRNKKILAFLILLFPFLVAAQNEITPLINRMNKATGTEKIDQLNEIAKAYRNIERHTSLDYARQAFSLSVKSNYDQGKALAAKNEGICWFFIGNFDSASICYKQSLEVYTKIGDEKGKSACYNNLGLIAQETGKYDDALRNYQLSIDIDHKLGDEAGVAITKRNIADIFIYLGNWKKALNLLNEINLTFKNLSDKDGVMRTLINRATVYDNMKRFDEALADLKEAVSLAKGLNDSYAEQMALSNSGLVIWHKGSSSEALKMLNQVLGMSDGDENGYDILNTLWIMSEIYSADKDYATSNEILQKVLKRYEEMDNKREQAKVLTSLGRNLIELNEIDKALGYLNESLAITISLDAPFEMLENYRNLAQANAILHNFNTADSLQDKFAETYAKLQSSDSLFGKKQELIKSESSINSSRSTSTDWIIAFSVIGILMLLSVMAYRRTD